MPSCLLLAQESVGPEAYAAEFHPSLFLMIIGGLGLLFLLAIGVATLTALVVAARRGHWAPLLVVGAALTIPMLLVLGFVGMRRAPQQQPPVAMTVSGNGYSHRTVTVSDERSIAGAVAPAEPDLIALDEHPAAPEGPLGPDNVPAPPVAAEIESDEDFDLGEPVEPRPDWVEGDLADNQKVFTSGPFTTTAQCEIDAQRQLGEWAWSRAGDGHAEVSPEWIESSEVGARFHREEHLEKRETSVGEVYLLYTLGEIDQADADWLEERVAFWADKAQRERGVAAIATGGAALLGAVGLLHGVLRAGGRREPAQEA